MTAVSTIPNLDLTSLALFGNEAERGEFPAIDVGGFLVPGEESSPTSYLGKEEQNNGRATGRQETRPAAGPRQRSRRSQAEAEAEASTTSHPVERRVMSEDLEELRLFHPDVVVTDLSSSGFPHLIVCLPVRLFRDLPFRAELNLEVPLILRNRLRSPSLGTDYGEMGGQLVRWYGPTQFYHLNPLLERAGYAEPLVPDVRAWARWVGGPYHRVPIESHHQNPDRGICACKPEDWILGVNPLVDFVGMCISWIGKALHERELGFYPGPQHYGVWKRIERDRPDEFCGCGEGMKRYHECCRDTDLQQTAFQLWSGQYTSMRAYYDELSRQGRPTSLPAEPTWHQRKRLQQWS